MKGAGFCISTLKHSLNKQAVLINTVSIFKSDVLGIEIVSKKGKKMWIFNFGQFLNVSCFFTPTL